MFSFVVYDLGVLVVEVFPYIKVIKISIFERLITSSFPFRSLTHWKGILAQVWCKAMLPFTLLNLCVLGCGKRHGAVSMVLCIILVTSCVFFILSVSICAQVYACTCLHAHTHTWCRIIEQMRTEIFRIRKRQTQILILIQSLIISVTFGQYAP